MDAFRVLLPGPYTTVQDKGRYGYQQFGIPPAGALDPFAYRVANLLVGNPEDAAVLETTIAGPRLEVLAEADVAVTGAQAAIRLNDQPMACWASFRVQPGDLLNVGQVKSGCRSYIAVTGGIAVPLVMNSRSCYVGGAIGGHEGRLAAKDDVLKRFEGKMLAATRRLPEVFIPQYPASIILRAVPGPQDDFFNEGLDLFFESEFIVSPDANRMGYRLEGPKIPHRQDVSKSIISEPSLPGSVQIPPDGRAIILLVEQTVGGYTKIATVISSDIPHVAQAKPGDKIRFKRLELAAAYEAFRQQEETLRQIRNQLSAAALATERPV
ncbi:MAG: biotin-dependent carboxyltransferase family protein [Desulfobacterales bacterium]|jgi:antagonist of KipI